MACIRDAYSLTAPNPSIYPDVMYRMLIGHAKNGSAGIDFVNTERMMADIVSRNWKGVKFGELFKLAEKCWVRRFVRRGVLKCSESANYSLGDDRM